MLDDLNTALVHAHRVDLAREAASTRLARLASRCKPSALRVSVQRFLAWLRRGQLGPRFDDGCAASITSRGWWA